MEKKLGHISDVSFGYGGYQDAMLGISFIFSAGGSGWGCGDFWGTWATEITEGTKWTEQERIIRLGKTSWRVKGLLDNAKVKKLSDLKGKPVEVSFNGNSLHSWRILKEVL